MTGLRQAVILAGGKGTRLASRLAGAPKPLVDVDGVPLLERQLRSLSKYGFGHVLMLVNYRADAIKDFCASVDLPSMTVEVVQDSAGPRGTAGAVWDAAHLLDDRFLVVYGDTLFDVDLDRFWRAHETARIERQVYGTLFLHPNDHPYDSDLVEMDETGLIRAFHAKPHAEGAFHRNMVNAALYVLEKSILNAVSISEGIVDFGGDLFPQALAEDVPMQGYATFEYIKDIGTPDRLDRAVGDLRSGKIMRSRLDAPQRAVFLDRDGTLNVPNGHISTPDGLMMLDGVGQAVARLNRAEYRCVMITNQPVLARGDVTIRGLEAIHAKLETELGRSAAFLDASYVCPHYPESGFPGEVAELKITCNCRKPAPGLLERAISDLSIDRRQSWMIGDSEADIGAARAAGVKSILVRTGGRFAAALSIKPDIEVDDLPAAVDFILSTPHSLSRGATRP
jgi:D,D-heptose 1,7-bisphosphate phosphatase